MRNVENTWFFSTLPARPSITHPSITHPSITHPSVNTSWLSPGTPEDLITWLENGDGWPRYQLGGRLGAKIERGLCTERARLDIFRGFGTERARLGTYRGFSTERARLATFKKITIFLKFSLKMSISPKSWYFINPGLDMCEVSARLEKVENFPIWKN